MESALFRYVIGEFSKTIDETLLPQTTISSLGLRLAVKLHPIFKASFADRRSMPKDRLFAEILEEFLLCELGYKSDIKYLGENRFRLSVKECPFQEYRSPSLCTVMRGIIGGLVLMSFGYCKLIQVSGPEQISKSCIADMYTKQTEEAENRSGIEYSKRSITLLHGGDEKIIEIQRNIKRKLVLGIFSTMALSYNEGSPENLLVQRYIEALSCIPDIKIAAIYLRNSNTGQYVLAADYGIPQEILPTIKVIGTEDNFDGSYDESLLEAIEEFDAHKEIIKNKLSIRSFSFVKLSVQNKIIGALNIGWKTSFPISFELRNAIADSCTLLATIIDNERLYLDLESSHYKLEKAYLDGISLINNLVSALDLFLGSHCRRVADLSEAVAIKMGLPQEEALSLYHAALIHDIGKANIRPEILNKPGKLTEEEFEIIKEHPRIGAELISPVPLFKASISTVLYHHERLDGSGYPEGLIGGKIPLHARIIAVADTFDAMTTRKSYREAFSEEMAIDELVSGSGIKYDTSAVRALIAVLKERNANQARLSNFA